MSSSRRLRRTSDARAALRRMQLAVRRTIATARRIMRERKSRAAQPVPRWLARHWERLLHRLLRHGRATVGNRIRLFNDGDDAMEAIWNVMGEARRRIAVEMYIVHDDRVGKRTIAELVHAAQRGCHVSLLIDGLGSSKLPYAALQPLRAAGPGLVEIAVFNPLRPWRWPARRDHCKIVIVDQQVGFCGGMNLSEDYAGARHGNSMFHDSMVQVEGPCVYDLARVFASSWKIAAPRELNKRARKRHRASKLPSASIGESFVQVQESRGVYGKRSIQRALRLTIRKAVSYCYITTPYFVPPLLLVRAIRRAAKRGVDVRILTAGVSDVPMVSRASQHIYGGLLRDGVRIFEMIKPVLHAKTITIDGVYSTVGSFNLDTWSDKRNMECNVAIIDPQIASEMHSVFMSNIATAREITMETWGKRPWHQRLIHWMAYHVMRL